MKQTNKKAMFGSATQYEEEELVVSEILLDLATIISVSESKREKFTWGVKRKRSNGPSFSRAPSSSAQFVKQTELTRVNNLASPITPLSFLPSESDENNNNNGLADNLKKMSREECVKMEEQLIQSRDCLRREIENVKRNYNLLKEENGELKAKKQQVLKGIHIEENPEMEVNRPVNHMFLLDQYFGKNVVPYPNLEVEGQNIQYQFGQFTNQLDFVNEPVNQVVGPRGIPDLNLSAEEAFGLDVSRPLDMNAVNAEKRARYAEARRLRRGIIKIKAMRSACGITMPTIN